MNATPTDPIAFQGLIRFDPMLALSFLDISTRWGMLGLICLLAAILSISFFFLLPYASTRFLSLLLGKFLFRLRVKDAHHVPATGPVLLIGNPASYMGWLWFLAASPRKIRFVLLGGWTSLGINGWLLRRANAITLAGNTPADFAEVFRKARAALGQGEAVCIFSEGCKADGVNPHYLSDIFREIAENQSVPVLPVCLHQPDGSMFLLRGGKFLRRWPPETPSSVYVQFGPLLPAGTTVLAARQALQETSAQLAIERNGQSRTVHQRFIRIAAKHPFKVCWIDSSAPGQSMTYAAAYAGSRCLAGLLAEFLAPDEERVGIWLPPGRGSAMTNIALAFLGKTSVNLNYSGPVDSAHAALKQCSCRHVLTSKRFLDRVPFQPPEGVKLVPLEDLLPKLRRSRKLLAFLSAVLLPGWFIDRFVLKTHRHRLDSLATIIFSSGSTGEPKGVMLTHGNITANVQSMVQAINIGPEDRLLGVLPFFHSFGYTVALWAPLYVGASSVYHADPRQAREIGELCSKNACTIYLSTATFLRFCLKKCGPQDFATLRIIICGAEKLPPSLALDFQARFGILPLEGYGCTELAPATAANLPDITYRGVTQIQNKIGTVGSPLPGCAARIIHPETGQPLPLGETGLVIMTGANVMKGYFEKPKLTSNVLLDGWYVTGDMGRLDADGHLTLTGRLSRFAKVGGEMVPLERIEEALHSVLETSERICAVTCIPDEARGERVIVLYVHSHLVNHCSEVKTWLYKLDQAGLPNLWAPSERDFHSVEELPVLGSGKLNIQRIKEMALALARPGHKAKHH